MGEAFVRRIADAMQKPLTPQNEIDLDMVVRLDARIDSEMAGRAELAKRRRRLRKALREIMEGGNSVEIARRALEEDDQ